MALLLGDKRTFAAEVGDPDGTGLSRVDLWAAGQWLTCDDNAVYVPQFRHYVGLTLNQLPADAVPFPGLSPADAHRRFLADDDGSGESFRFFDGWGPTTDNVTSFLFRHNGGLVLTAEFWRQSHLRAHPEHAGVVFTADIPTDELIGILEGLVAAL